MNADDRQLWWETLNQQYGRAGDHLHGKYQHLATARKCAWCVGYPRPGWRQRIEDCTTEDCPLWKHRP